MASPLAGAPVQQDETIQAAAWGVSEHTLVGTLVQQDASIQDVARGVSAQPAAMGAYAQAAAPAI